MKARNGWLIAAALVALSIIPVGGGLRRLAELWGGAQITLENARFFAAEYSTVLHILSCLIFNVLGAFQFVPWFRRQWPAWHRQSGRLLSVCGLAAALSGVWMTLTYPRAEGDNDLLWWFRLIFGGSWAVFMVLGFMAIRRRDITQHRAWMTRGYAIGAGAGVQALVHIPWFLIVGAKPGVLARSLLLGAGWVISLAVAEWSIRRRTATRATRPGKGKPMKNPDPAAFHRLFGARSQRLAYHKGDFVDYALMSLLCWVVVCYAFGPAHPMSLITLALCAFMVVSFLIRHGCQLRTPAIVKRPQDSLYLLVYKLLNLKAPYLIAAGLLLLENYLIHLTPSLPHHTELMRSVALGLFYSHLILLTGFRTASLISHLRRKEHVREFVMQTTWKSALERQPSVVFEIVHAYFTGLLAHILLLTPWYIVITHVSYSLVFLPVTVAANLILNVRFMQVMNEWFYRDHWLGHNSELEFLYLHGAHHDAIPSGLIGVSGNGYLEGFMRYALGGPGAFYNPLVLFMVYTLDVKMDIEGHQFIPGVLPRVATSIREINQHSTHHYGRLEPYGLGWDMARPGVSAQILKKAKLMPTEVKTSVRLDEQLNGFKWDTPRHQRFLELYAKYSTPEQDAGLALTEPVAGNDR